MKYATLSTLLLLGTGAFASDLLRITDVHFDCQNFQEDIPCPVAVTLTSVTPEAFNSSFTTADMQYHLSVFTADAAKFPGESELATTQDGPWARTILKPLEAVGSSSAIAKSMIVHALIPFPRMDSTRSKFIGVRVASNVASGETTEDVWFSAAAVTIHAGKVASAPTLSYPMVFIHGLKSSSESSWAEFRSYLIGKGLVYGGTLSFCLNSDGIPQVNLLKYDVRDFTRNSEIKKGDFYLINFDVDTTGLTPIPYTSKGSTDVLSNQEAIVKQGYAVSLAIARIKAVTGKNKVMVMGHSMGGLAAREYLQNPDLWGGKDHGIGRLVTVATPHGGSDIGSIAGPMFGELVNLDAHSNAVRDLRTAYHNDTAGVFLYGGDESQVTATLGSFYSKDVNCNGTSTDKIVGLNQKAFPVGLPATSFIGYFLTTLEGPNDGVVTTHSANLNNFYPDVHADTSTVSGLSGFHTNIEKKNSDMLFNALDVPDSPDLQNDISLTAADSGLASDWVYVFANRQFNATKTDADSYGFTIPSGGNLHITLANIASPDVSVSLSRGSTSILGKTLHRQDRLDSVFQVAAGYHTLTIESGTDSISFRAPMLLKLEYRPVAAISLARQEDLGQLGLKAFFRNGALVIDLVSALESQAKIRVSDLNGKAVGNPRQEALRAGPNRISMDIGPMGPGLKVVNVSTPKGSESILIRN